MRDGYREEEGEEGERNARPAVNGDEREVPM